MSCRTITLFIILLFFSHTSELVAQELSVGFYGGVLNYQGDLVEGIVDLKELQPAYGASLKYLWFKDIAITGGVLLGKLTGDDANSEKLANRGYSFSSNFTELSLNIEYHPLGEGRWNRMGEFMKSISPYVYGGVGYHFGRPEVVGLEMGSEDFLNEKTSRIVVPFGIGVQATVNERFYISLEGGSRYVTDDYIDGVSISGNPGAKDWYFTGGLKFGVYLSGEPSMF